MEMEVWHTHGIVQNGVMVDGRNMMKNECNV